MKPSELNAASFAAYPPEGRSLALDHLALLRSMPLALLPAYLRQLQQADALFPVEAARLHLQLEALAAKPGLMSEFSRIAVPPPLQAMHWVEEPARFEAALSASLWQSGQIDAYHRAASALFAALPEPPAPQAPLLVGILGQGATAAAGPVFTRARKDGLYLRRISETDAADAIRTLVAARAQGDRQAYAHWYVDGGAPLWPLPAGVAGFTYPQAAPVRQAVVREMDRAVRDGAGPERLAEQLQALPPASLNLRQASEDSRIARFLLSLLTEGSGTQIYSTSFVQAAALGLIRRAQPETLVVRFAPRRKAASLNDLLQARSESAELDADGALGDADMALWYSWLALRRLSPGARMLLWVEGRGEAFAAGPGVVRGAESATPMGLAGALKLVV